MTSPVDSAPYFVQRAEEISLARRVSDALKAKGVTTLAQLAFCVGQPGQVLAQADFDTWSESILANLTVGEKASLRRLILEAQTMLVASLKDMAEPSESAAPKNAKPITTSLSLEGGKLKITETDGVEDRDIEGSLQVLNAPPSRRGICFCSPVGRSTRLMWLLSLST